MNKRLKLVIENKFKGKNTLFSEAIGISPQHLQAYLTGRSNPGSEKIEKIGKLGVNIHWLVTGEGEMEFQKPENEIIELKEENKKLRAIVSTVAESIEKYVVKKEDVVKSDPGIVKPKIHENKNSIK